MYGAFGGYTRWAVVFLIIFVLFFLFVPVGVAAAPVTGVAVSYNTTSYDMGPMGGMHTGMGPMGTMGMGEFGSSSS